jgi:hypothetical protein
LIARQRFYLLLHEGVLSSKMMMVIRQKVSLFLQHAREREQKSM